MSLRIVKLVETCSAAPSQWEGELSDGRMFFVHYRHGTLSIGFGETANDAVDDSDNHVFQPSFAFERECLWTDAEPYLLGLISPSR